MTTCSILRILASPIALAAAVLTGCATPGSESPATDGAAAPAAAATARQLADLSGSLRCMDNLLVDFGASNLTFTIDELADQTRKAASRETLVAAIAGMTTRSRAIRLVADPARRERIAGAQHYAIRGVVGPEGIQLGLVSAQDNTVVAGVGARSALVRVRQGSGSRTTAEVHKLGERFGVAPGADETRVLVELAAIELVGKLTKVPYWSCLGITDQNEAVAAEIQDWFDGMVERPAEIIGYFQRQLRLREVYQGAVSGTANPEFREAIARYREALGLTREAKFSLDFYQAYLSADHRAVVARLQAARMPAQVPPPAHAAPPVIATVPAQPEIEARPLPPSVTNPAPPLALRVATASATQRFAAGEVLQFNVRPNRDAHVYCYLQDEHQKVRQVFPNRFQRDSRVDAATGLALPGAMRFEIAMNSRGQRETLLCVASERNVLANVGARIAGRDFEPLPVQSLDDVRRAFIVATGGQLAQDQFHLLPK